MQLSIPRCSGLPLTATRDTVAVRLIAHRPRASAPSAAASGHGDACSVRINKAFREFASRREADRFVATGRVTVNGVLASPGQQITLGDVVALDGRPVNWEALQAELAPPEPVLASEGDDGWDDGTAPLPMEARFLYVKYWKPRGVTCTTDARVRGNIAAAVRHPSGARLFHVGRLDKDSTGLVLLTNDGRVPNAALRAANGHAKLYRVVAHAPVPPRDAAALAAGVVITTAAQRDRGPPKVLTARTRPCRVAHDPADASGRTLLIELREGRNRQIRRMLEALGYDTVELHRLTFMGIGLQGLGPGRWAELSEGELAAVRSAVRGAQRRLAADAAPQAWRREP